MLIGVELSAKGERRLHRAVHARQGIYSHSRYNRPAGRAMARAKVVVALFFGALAGSAQELRSLPSQEAEHSQRRSYVKACELLCWMSQSWTLPSGLWPASTPATSRSLKGVYRSGSASFRGRISMHGRRCTAILQPAKTRDAWAGSSRAVAPPSTA
jgi:hypothetical protein